MFKCLIIPNSVPKVSVYSPHQDRLNEDLHQVQQAIGDYVQITEES